MLDFDARHLPPREIAPAEIKRLREANNVSQRVFARCLNTSESTVEKWESGTEQPSPPLRKLLSVVQKHGFQVLT